MCSLVCFRFKAHPCLIVTMKIGMDEPSLGGAVLVVRQPMAYTLGTRLFVLRGVRYRLEWLGR
jgi:hypothetical protein